jgi:IMP dehydrogenase
MKNIYNIDEGDVWWSASDIGWIVGHSYIVYAPLFKGCTTIIFEGRKFKTFRGMGSVDAMQDGSKDRYFQTTENDPKKLVPEGIVGRVAYKGALSEVIHQMIGGLRAGMGYCGAKNITDLAKARFIKITAAGVTESHPHDVTVTREAPNYSRK